MERGKWSLVKRIELTKKEVDALVNLTSDFIFDQFEEIDNLNKLSNPCKEKLKHAIGAIEEDIKFHKELLDKLEKGG